MRERVASLTSNILNPLLVSLILILLLSFKSAPTVMDAVKWVLISMGVSILPVLLVIIYLVRNQRLESLFIIARRQRTKVYLLSSICAGIACILFTYLGAPQTLRVAFIAGLSAVVVFMCVNLLWKISLHTAFATASVIVLTVLYGPVAATTAVLVPLIGWSRVELKHHSLAQVVTGAILAALIVFAVFYFFDLVTLG